MATVSLYTSAAHPDAWHQVRAPGGYEWWYFDAEDIEHDRQLVVIVFDGFVFHPQYLRRYFRYRRRPTRIDPPVPSDYPAAYFVLYERGRLRCQFLTQFPAGQCRASARHLDVQLGPNSIRAADDGSIHLTAHGTPWILTMAGPKLLKSQEIQANITFTPRTTFAPHHRPFLSGQHQWIIANPRCDVDATILIDREFIVFHGRGYHDHNYGTAPIALGPSHWFWGRALTDEGAVIFQAAENTAQLLEANSQRLCEQPVERFEADWSARTWLGLKYPTSVRFDDFLSLSNPRVIDSAPFYIRVQYHAYLRGRPESTAFCEVAYPRRLRWPILGRMIEMSIDNRHS